MQSFYKTLSIVTEKRKRERKILKKRNKPRFMIIFNVLYFAHKTR